MSLWVIQAGIIHCCPTKRPYFRLELFDCLLYFCFQIKSNSRYYLPQTKNMQHMDVQFPVHLQSVQLDMFYRKPTNTIDGHHSLWPHTMDCLCRHTKNTATSALVNWPLSSFQLFEAISGC